MDILTLAEDASLRVRQSLGLPAGEAPRIAYLPGPGDVVGTYRYWQRGEHDPRVPIISYSAMFYELMHRLGAQVEVISPVVKNTSSGETDGWIRFVHVDRPSGRGGLSYYLGEHAYLSAICRELDRFEPHIVLTSTDLSSHGWHRLRRGGRRLVVTAHNTFWPMGRKPRGLKARIQHFLLARQLRAMDAAVCTSDECRRQIHEMTQGRVSGLVECPQLLADYRLEDRKSVRNLLFIGRIEVNKGVFMLLEAFSMLKQRFPNLTLTFAGTGGAEAALKERVAQLGQPGIDLTGHLDSAGVHQCIATSDLLICPTTSAFNEGLAVVGIEAAAHGLPSLLSSVVPVADLLGDGCVVFAVDDTVALHNALERLIVDENAYLKALSTVRAQRGLFYDRSLSWGSQLGKVLLSL